MLKKKQAEEHSRKSLNQRNAAILWGMNVDERRALCFQKITTLAESVKFLHCMFFNSSRQRIYDNSKGNYLFD